MPSRSFFVLGYQFPLCYRCTGLFLGTLAFLVMIYRNQLPALRIALLLLLPMLVDVGLQSLGWWESVNGLRLVTGIGFGVGMPATMLVMIGCFYRSDMDKADPSPFSHP